MAIVIFASMSPKLESTVEGKITCIDAVLAHTEFLKAIINAEFIINQSIIEKQFDDAFYSLVREQELSKTRAASLENTLKSSCPEAMKDIPTIESILLDISK